MNIRYISISGNTRSFVQRLTTYAEEQHQHNEKNPTITFKEISENSPLEVETEPVFYLCAYLFRWWRWHQQRQYRNFNRSHARISCF